MVEKFIRHKSKRRVRCATATSPSKRKNAERRFRSAWNVPVACSVRFASFLLNPAPVRVLPSFFLPLHPPRAVLSAYPIFLLLSSLDPPPFKLTPVPESSSHEPNVYATVNHERSPRGCFQVVSPFCLPLPPLSGHLFTPVPLCRPYEAKTAIVTGTFDQVRS